MLKSVSNLNFPLQNSLEVKRFLNFFTSPIPNTPKSYNIFQNLFCLKNHRVSPRTLSVNGFHNFIYNLQVPLPTSELVSYNTYAPSKFAITAFNEVLRHELTWEKNEKIRVSSLSPGEWESEARRKTKAIETINQLDWQ